jgi:hypothetical protein
MYISNTGTIFKRNDKGYWVATNNDFELVLDKGTHPAGPSGHLQTFVTKAYNFDWKKACEVTKILGQEAYIFKVKTSVLSSLFKTIVPFEDLLKIISVQNYESFMANSGRYDRDPEDIGSNIRWREQIELDICHVYKKYPRLMSIHWRHLNKYVVIDLKI